MRSRVEWILTLVLAYAPLLASSPGKVGADTKTYLYLDPGRLLAEAASMWDADTSLGTVTHQNIGYLFPMGPWYWVFDTLGVPDWVAQRLWLGTLIFAAAMGVRFMLRTMGWKGPGVIVAMLAYALSPYLLDYSARISAVLLPWAGLGWMIAFTMRAARSQGWRDVAAFALVTLTIGSVNATSLLLVGLAPVLWLAHASLIEASISIRDAVAAAVRIGVATLGVSLWWIAGLAVQGGYSLPVTRYTETYQVVAGASTGPEIWRGLGYWFFYGNDKFGPWIEPSVTYSQRLWLLALSFGLPVLAIASSALIRWRGRSFFILLAVVGFLMGVGSHPIGGSSVLGDWFEGFTRTDAGLALRSTPRAVPMLILATAVMLGALGAAVHERWPGRARWAEIGLVVAVVANIPPLWTASMIEPNLNRDENLPDYWIEATDAINADPDTSRVLEIPGADFASYRWGNTVDPITPGLIDKQYVARELVPFGSGPSAALVSALDRRFQEDTIDLDSIAPVARLLSIDEILHRADLTYERFRTPRPVGTNALLTETPDLEFLAGYGAAEPNVARASQPLLDEIELGQPEQGVDPNPVARYRIDGALPEVRLRNVAGPTVLVGDSDGLIDALGAQAMDTDRTVWFAAELPEQVLDEPARVVITDSNRRRARRWGTIREVEGYTERAGETPLIFDPRDNRLPVFDPDLPDEARTVARHVGPVAVRATAYGNDVTYTVDDRPVYAVDGDLTTAWSVAAFAEARGRAIELVLETPKVLETLRLTQRQEPANRTITEISIQLDDDAPFVVAMDDSSRSVEGQSVPIPDSRAGTEISRVYIEITDTDFPRSPTYPGVSAVGFAEIDLGLGAVEEVIVTPTALVDELAGQSDIHSYSVVLTRERTNPREPVRTDAELRMAREVDLPFARTMALTGTARLSPIADEGTINALVGLTRSAGGASIEMRSSQHLAGELLSAASSAFDGNPGTAWTGFFGPQGPQWLEITSDQPFAAGQATVTVVVDDRHSRPKVIDVAIDGVGYGGTAVPEPGDGETTVDVVVPIPIAGSTLQFSFLDNAERTTQDWYSGVDIALPLSIVDIDLGPETAVVAPTAVATACRDDLVQLDGEAVPVRISGSAEVALSRGELQVEACDPVAMLNGANRIATAPGSVTGLDLDQLVFADGIDLAPVPVLPPVTIFDRADTRMTGEIGPTSEPAYLVLGQSKNLGWTAQVDGIDLGEPILVDGYANGWFLEPSSEVRSVTFHWTPESTVKKAILASVLAVLACIALAVLGRRRPKPVLALDVEPHWTRAVGPAPTSWPAPIGLALAAGGFAAINLPSHHWFAVVIGIGVGLTVRRPSFAPGLGLLAATSLGLAALLVLVQQRRFRYPPDFVWPQQFEDVHVLGVVAALILFGEYLRSAHTAMREPRQRRG